jgi:fumarate hydratase class II
MSERYRIEHDSQGELRVPAQALYGAQTQRAVENFSISGLRMPGPFVRALGRIKSAAARVNADLGLLDTGVAGAISMAADEIATHVSACLDLHNDLLPALEQLRATIDSRAVGLSGMVKTGRTHLMDALPVRAGRDHAAGAAARQQHHARQDEPGDTGGSGYGLCPGDR